MKPWLVVLNHPVTWMNLPPSLFELLLPPEGTMASPDLVACIFNLIVFFQWRFAAETGGDTHRTRCGRERTLCSARRRLETVWPSWCMEGTSESQSSQSSFSGGSTSSSPRIPLREAHRETRRTKNMKGGNSNRRISHITILDGIH